MSEPRETMTFEQFETLIARFGSDPAGWPDPTLAEAADVAEWLRAENELNARLRGLGAPALSANFEDRVISALPSEGSGRSRRTLWGASIAALFVAGVFGLTQMSGLFSPDNPLIDDMAEQDVWAVAAEDTGFGDLYEWVMDG